MQNLILHCDLNNFFATASLVSRPELQNVPVAVAGDPDKRHGIILAKNMPAKRKGVKTAEPIWKARQKCPELTVIKPDYPLYIDYSDRVKAIYYRYTGNIEPFGIDECWLDISGYQNTITDGTRIAYEIKDVVKRETGLTLSIGVSFSKVFAKLGSDYKKPDAVTTIARDNYHTLAWPLPVDDLICVGRATKSKLHKIAVTTIGDLATAPEAVLKRLLGKNGLMLREFANGIDDSLVKAVDHEFGFKGIGNSMTTARDLVCTQDVRTAFLLLAEMVSARMRAKDVASGCICIYLRDNQLTHITRQKTLDSPTFVSDEIAAIALDLYRQHWNIASRPIRSIGIRATDFVPILHTKQVSFFDCVEVKQKEALEFAKDRITEKFGKHAVVRASFIDDTAPKEQNDKNLHDVHPLSFFRR